MLDESDRKTGNLDVGSFAIPFSPHDEGLVDFLAGNLLRGRFEAKDIKVELSKLNVYGKTFTISTLSQLSLTSICIGPGGFCKAHVGTNRSMFHVGSLVVILPTVHEGGSLVLRQDGKEWKFDFAQVVSSTTPSSQAAFIASFSDVEHEVKPVISGFRVTLTYNLYDKTNSAMISESFETDLVVKEGLARLLEDPESFPGPYGGFIGFGLCHKYPLHLDSESDTTALSDIMGYLKGSDATIKRACDLLSLPVSIKAVYSNDESLAVLLDKIVDIEYRVDDTVLGHLECDYKGKGVVDYEDRENYDKDPIAWVRPLTFAPPNRFRSIYLTDHHKWPVAHIDGEVCLIATVPPSEECVDSD